MHVYSVLGQCTPQEYLYLHIRGRIFPSDYRVTCEYAKCEGIRLNLLLNKKRELNVFIFIT